MCSRGAMLGRRTSNPGSKDFKCNISKAWWPCAPTSKIMQLGELFKGLVFLTPIIHSRQGLFRIKATNTTEENSQRSFLGSAIIGTEETMPETWHDSTLFSLPGNRAISPHSGAICCLNCTGSLEKRNKCTVTGEYPLKSCGDPRNLVETVPRNFGCLSLVVLERVLIKTGFQKYN